MQRALTFVVTAASFVALTLVAQPADAQSLSLTGGMTLLVGPPEGQPPPVLGAPQDGTPPQGQQPQTVYIVETQAPPGYGQPGYGQPGYGQPGAMSATDVAAQRLAYGSALHEARSLAIRALLASPLSDEAHTAIIGLDFAGGSSEQSETLIESFVILRSQHGPSLVSAGRLAAQACLWKLASSAWTQAMAMEPTLTSSVIANFPADSPVSLASILPTNVKVLSIAAQQELAKNKPDIAVLTRASDLLERSQPTERGDQLQQLRLIARIYAKRGQRKLAAESLGKAILISPGDLELRYQYAMSLRESGNISEAREQARAGRRIAPNDPRFDQLLTAMGRMIDGPNE